MQKNYEQLLACFIKLTATYLHRPKVNISNSGTGAVRNKPVSALFLLWRHSWTKLKKAVTYTEWVCYNIQLLSAWTVWLVTIRSTQMKIVPTERGVPICPFCCRNNRLSKSGSILENLNHSTMWAKMPVKFSC